MPLGRQLHPHRGVLGQGFVELHTVFTLGASGAVSAVKGRGFETSDWTDNGTGDFTIQLPGSGTLNIYQVVATITGDATNDLVCVVRDVDEAARTINVEVWDLAATPVVRDPSSGSQLRLSVVLKESAD